MSFDPSQNPNRPRQPYMQGGGGPPGGGGGMNMPPNQMRQQMYSSQQQQQMPPQQQHQQQQQQQQFQNPQQMPPGQMPPGGGPPGMGHPQQQQQQPQFRVPRITPENFSLHFERLPPHYKARFSDLTPEQKINQLQRFYELSFKNRQMQQMRMNAPNAGGFPPQQQQQQPQQSQQHSQQQQQPQQQRFPGMPPQGNTDVQGGFIPVGPDQKPPTQQQQVPFPGPGPQGQKRKGPSPNVAAAAAPFPGPGPTAQNPSTMPTGSSSSQPPVQPPPQGLHQSQSQPSFNIQASQPPPQNPPGPDFKFGGGQPIKTEPQIPPPSQQQQQQQNQFGVPNSQQQQLQPPMPGLSSSQSQPSLLNQNNQPKFEFQNQPRPEFRPEMSQQQQQQQHQPMQVDFSGPPNLPPSQQQQQSHQQQQSSQNQQQQGFNVPTTTTQSMNQPIGQQPSQQSMNQQPPMPSSQQQQQHSFQPPSQQQQQQQQPSQQQMSHQPQQQLLQPRPPQGQMPSQSQQQQQQMGGQQPQQQAFGQGPSPVVNVQDAGSVGRVPTPSNKSAQSGGNNIPQTVLNSKEYQETLSRLKKYREDCYRLLQRMKLEGDSAITGMQKTIEVIDGKRPPIQIELMEKLIKNIISISQRYDISNGLRKVVDIIKATPTIDMSQLAPDPYEQYKHLRISAPKEYYKEADDARNDRQQQQYIKKRMKWFEENNFWNGTEPIPYPWKRSIRQYTSERLEEINREFNEKIFAPFDEPAIPYIPKDPNEPKKKVTFNAEVDVLIRVDAQPDDPGEENEYDEKESDESDDDVIVVEGDEEFEAIDDEEDRPEYENIEHFQSINNGNYGQPAYYDINGELQYAAPLQQQEVEEEEQQQTPQQPEVEQKIEPEDSEELNPPPAKRIKVEEIDPELSQQQQQYMNPPYDYNYGSYVLQPPQVVNVPGPSQNFEFPSGEHFEGYPQTLEDMEVAQSYEAYLQRQQQASYYEHLAMNTQMVQDELYANAMTMPNENYYQVPLMDPPPHEKADEPPPDCPYACCAPYEINSIMGKPALLPKAAATELRKFRHRVDYENQPLSEHSPFYAIIINPTKANSKIKYPELRINIPQNYPVEAIDFKIVKPSSIHGKSAKSFYEKLEKRMFERRLCGISLHTIGEVVSAFCYCVEIVHRKRDILDFSHMNIIV